MKSPRAVIFDLDGTLIDSRKDIAAACNHTLVWAGREPLPEDVVASFVGDGARNLLARAFALEPRSPEIDRALAEFVRFYTANPVVHTRWMPGALEALDALEVPVALVTNKAKTVTLAILDALKATSRFAAIYGGGDGPLKPSPEPLYTVTRAMGVAPADTWMIGDASQDIGAGKAAGCFTVGVRGGFHDRLDDADVVLNSLEELPKLASLR
jgi:phosphoglycolate phosphatase